MTETCVLIPEKLKLILVRKTASILEVMKVIDQGAVQAAFVMDDEDRLKGILTDGDLRRAILSGANLNDAIEPFVQKHYRSVAENASRTEALDLMKCHSIEQLPILSKDGRLVGLHLLNELIKSTSLPNAAMILAGGKGTRLGKLTESLPKPMIKVAGRPILERIVFHLIGGGVRNIFLSVNYLADVIEEHFGDGEKFGCNFTYLREDEPMGTGGPLSLLPQDSLNEPIIVMNGDLITDFSIDGLLRTHANEQNSITIGVRNYSHEVPFGCIKTNGNQIIELIEKPTHHETISTGIFAIDPFMIKLVPNSFFPITNLVDVALSLEERVGTFQIDDWIDVGQPDQLAEALGIRDQ